MKRSLLAAVSALLGLWLVLACLVSLYAGLSVHTLVFGFQFPLVLIKDATLSVFGSERHYDGLGESRAVALLKQGFGEGVTERDGRLLYDLITQRGYKRALDIGTAKGYSAIWMGLAVKRTGGKVITIEIEPAIASEARKNFIEAGLSDVIDSRVNDALVEIPRIPESFDFVFMDAGAPINTKLLGLLAARISPGGAIASHNALGFRLAQPGFLRAIENNSILETRIVPTSSGGMSLSVRKPDTTERQ